MPEENAIKPPRGEVPEGEIKKKKKKKRGDKHSNEERSNLSKQYGKQKDLFPELTSLPEFTNYEKFAGDDSSLNSSGTRYETKEDQDVAVFMALAGRMNLDSLLFILNGHAREMNLPSSEYLLPEKRKELDALRAKREFKWKEDENGNVATEVFEIESIKEEDLWFEDEVSQKILMSAIRDVRYYQANKPEYINSVETLATQSDNNETEGHMKALINDKHARGLEVHICSYIEEIRKEFINTVLDEQDDCEDAGEDYTTTAERMRHAALQYTVQSQEFAYKLAKCDHIVALKASLSKWDKPEKKKERKSQPRIRRDKSSSSNNNSSNNNGVPAEAAVQEAA